MRTRVDAMAVPVARFIVGGIFLVAGLDKVRAPGAFADAVRAFHLLPPSLVVPFALIVPWLEVLVGVYLLVGFLSRPAAVGGVVLLLSFVVALGSALVRGDTHHACGCFGDASHANPILVFLSGGSTITWWDLIRDLLLIGLVCVVLVRGAGTLSVDALRSRRRGRMDPERHVLELEFTNHKT